MDLVDENAINIYTDGSSYGRPRRGGVGIRFIHVGDDGHEVCEDASPPGYRDATNQEMELRSCVEALELLKRGKTNVPAERFKKILIHTDSQYVVNNFKTALYEWQVNGWRTRGGAPVVNAKLWNDLVRAVFRSGKQVEFTWVKATRATITTRRRTSSRNCPQIHRYATPCTPEPSGAKSRTDRSCPAASS
jgi:ribonuclease HI